VTFGKRGLSLSFENVSCGSEEGARTARGKGKGRKRNQKMALYGGFRALTLATRM